MRIWFPQVLKGSTSKISSKEGDKKDVLSPSPLVDISILNIYINFLLVNLVFI